MSNDNDVENVSVMENLPAVADSALIQIAEQAEKRMRAVKTIKRVALALTNANDWVNENGKPYMMSSAGEKIARFLGISWQIDEPKKEVFSDGHYEWSYRGTFSFAGASIAAIGARNSRDGFFSKRSQWDPEKQQKVPFNIPPSEVDSSDVKKSAYTNLLANGITRLLGMRNLSWEDLECAGIRQDDVAGVEYKTSKPKEQPGKWVDTNKKPKKEEADRMKAAGLGKWRKNQDGTFTWLEKVTEKPHEPPKPEAKAEPQPQAGDVAQAATASADGISEPQRKKLFATMKEVKLPRDEQSAFYHFALSKYEATSEWATGFISMFPTYLEVYQQAKNRNMPQDDMNGFLFFCIGKRTVTPDLLNDVVKDFDQLLIDYQDSKRGVENGL